MPTHVPVLAGELIEALDPQPGQVAVDCTLGAAGHARLVADRLGPSGMLIAIDRDPLAEEAFAELAAEVACATRFIRADFEHGLRLLAEEGVQADLVYLDLGMGGPRDARLEAGRARGHRSGRRRHRRRRLLGALGPLHLGGLRPGPLGAWS